MSFSVRTQWWIVAFLVAIGISSVWYVTKSPRYGFVLAGQQAPMIGGLRRVGPKLGYNVESGQVGTGPALIVVFASWCAACRQEMPSLEALSTRFKTQGLHISAVSIDSRSDEDAVRAFARDQGLTFEVLLDPSALVARKYGVNAIPEAFIVDGSGRVQERLIGTRDWSNPELVHRIEEVLANTSSRDTVSTHSMVSDP